MKTIAYRLGKPCCLSLARLVVVIVVALAWTSVAFCDEIQDAAASGDLEKVKALLEDNPDLVFSIDDYGATPLHWAALNGQKDVAELLLESNADVNAKNNYGITPLHEALVNNHTDVAELLRQHGGLDLPEGDSTSTELPATTSQPVTEETPADSDQSGAVGSLQSHNLIWGKYVEWVKRQQEIENAWNQKTALESNISVLNDQISAKIIQTNDPITLDKDEFETTSEWQIRCDNATAERNQNIQANVEDIKNQISVLHEKIDDLGILIPLSGEPVTEQLDITPESNEFLLKVTMGTYDADSETVSGFSYSETNTVGGTSDDPLIFKFQGDLSGMSIPREKARLMREASNRGELWIRFEAQPNKCEFRTNYFTCSTNREIIDHSQDLLPDKKTILKRGAIIAIGKAFGADDRTIDGAAGGVDDTPTGTEEVTTWENHSADIIKTGWSGAPSPDSVLIYDHTNNQWQTLWEKTQ